MGGIMSDSNVVLPAELAEALKDRAVLWQNFDTARNRAGQIEALSRGIHTNEIPEPISEIASAENPVAEINATLQELQAEKAVIEKSENQIRENNERIQFLNQKIRNRYITFFVAVGVVGLILLCMVFQALTQL
jgi:hypothetical protein